MTITRPPGPEQRETERSYLHRLDSEYALIMSPQGELKARVLDITPKGIGLALEGSAARFDWTLEKGDLIPIRIERGGQWVEVKARLATKNETLLERDRLRLGFRIESDEEALLPAGESKPSYSRPHRVSLADAPILNCETDDPSRPGQRAFFKIRDLSLKGALLETSARNKFLLPNLKLTLAIAIPGHGRYSEDIVLRRVQSAQDRYLVGIEFTKLKAETVAALADYCVNFAKDLSFQIMLEEGFPAHILEESLTVQAMASQQDFLQITRIRLAAEHAKGRRLDWNDPWLMMDEQDSEARHISVKLGKRVIASTRILEEEGDALSVSLLVYDKDFSRAVKGPRAELVIWREIFRSALLSGKSLLIVKQLDDIPDFLWKLGAVKTLDSYRIEIPLLQSGRDARFRVWARIIAPILREQKQSHKLTITGFHSLKLWFAEQTVSAEV